MKDTKEHILKTSLLLFLQKSYKEVTMKDIVQKTGLSKGAFYHHFSSKEELYREITNVFFTLGIIDYTFFPKNSLDEFYHHYVETVGSSFQKINEFIGNNNEGNVSFNFFLIIFEAISRFPEFLTFELEQHHKDLKAWTKVIKYARAQGEIKSSCTDSQIADLFLYCTDGVFIRFINNDQKSNFKSDLLMAFNNLYMGLKV